MYCCLMSCHNCRVLSQETAIHDMAFFKEKKERKQVHFFQTMVTTLPWFPSHQKITSQAHKTRMMTICHLEIHLMIYRSISDI